MLKSARVKAGGASSYANKMDRQNNQAAEPQGNRFRRYWPLLAELWIFATVLAFFVIRVLGSEFFHHKFHFLVGR